MAFRTGSARLASPTSSTRPVKARSSQSTLASPLPRSSSCATARPRMKKANGRSSAPTSSSARSSRRPPRSSSPWPSTPRTRLPSTRCTRTRSRTRSSSRCRSPSSRSTSATSPATSKTWRPTSRRALTTSVSPRTTNHPTFLGPPDLSTSSGRLAPPAGPLYSSSRSLQFPTTASIRGLARFFVSATSEPHFRSSARSTLAAIRERFLPPALPTLSFACAKFFS
mmetsp:Transcript_16169/g.51653  ORF Transcript_16169/g.51653 Transcript_16169/m.51653 type:complete len:225 (+) Transcript_16169:1147-1821(+)